MGSGINKEKVLEAKMASLGIKENDIEEKFIRSGGPGGQKVNKTSSCVYLKHKPTGIEVKYQGERSQVLNRFFARRILANKIETLITKGAHMGKDEIMRCDGSKDCHEKNHICRIIISKDLGRIKELVKDAQFFCKNCGRAAHNPENLCNPSRI